MIWGMNLAGMRGGTSSLPCSGLVMGAHAIGDWRKGPKGPGKSQNP